MNTILAVLFNIAVLLMLVVITVYHYFDRRRFYLEQMLKKASPALDAWVAACERLTPGCGETYRRVKKPWEKSEAIQDIVNSVTENSPEKLDIQESLISFCAGFREMAMRYNRKLETPFVGRLGQLLGFRYFTVINFYPDKSIH